MFLLQLDGFAKKVDAEQGRLAAVPGEAHDFPWGGLNMLDDIAFQRFVVQSKISSLGIELLLFEVIAVVTVEVTDRTDCLHHDLKFTRRSFQRDYLRPWGTLLKKVTDVTTCWFGVDVAVKLLSSIISFIVGWGTQSKFLSFHSQKKPPDGGFFDT